MAGNRGRSRCARGSWERGQLGESGERCELPQRGSGRSPDRPKVFHYFQHSGWPLLTLWYCSSWTIMQPSWEDTRPSPLHTPLTNALAYLNVVAKICLVVVLSWGRLLKADMDQWRHVWWWWWWWWCMIAARQRDHPTIKSVAWSVRKRQNVAQQQLKSFRKFTIIR